MSDSRGRGWEKGSKEDGSTLIQQVGKGTLTSLIAAMGCIAPDVVEILSTLFFPVLFFLGTQEASISSIQNCMTNRCGQWVMHRDDVYHTWAEEFRSVSSPHSSFPPARMGGLCGDDGTTGSLSHHLEESCTGLL